MCPDHVVGIVDCSEGVESEPTTIRKLALCFDVNSVTAVASWTSIDEPVVSSAVEHHPLIPVEPVMAAVVRQEERRSVGVAFDRDDTDVQRAADRRRRTARNRAVTLITNDNTKDRRLVIELTAIGRTDDPVLKEIARREDNSARLTGIPGRRSRTREPLTSSYWTAASPHSAREPSHSLALPLGV